MGRLGAILAGPPLQWIGCWYSCKALNFVRARSIRATVA